MRKIVSQSLGFTLIELTVVFVILGLLLSFILFNIFSSVSKSRDKQRKRDLAAIQASLEEYRAVNKIYPAPPLYANVCPTSSALTDGTTMFMKTIPYDPVSKNCYFYDAPGGTSYTMYACLENQNDPERDATPQPTCSPNPSFTIQEQ